MKRGLSVMAYEGQIKDMLENMQEADIKELLERLDILGNSDIAKILNWTTSKVTLYMQRGSLPAPITYIGGRPAWTKAQIERFIKKGGLK